MESNHHGPIEALVEKAEALAKTSIDLYKLKAVEKSSDAASSLASRLIIGCVFLFFMSVLNIGISLWLGEALGKTYYGFLAVAGFYALVGTVLFLFRNEWLKKPVSNSMIRGALN